MAFPYSVIILQLFIPAFTLTPPNLPPCDLSLPLIEDCEAHITQTWLVEQEAIFFNAVRIICDTGKADCISVRSGRVLQFIDSIIQGKNCINKLN